MQYFILLFFLWVNSPQLAAHLFFENRRNAGIQNAECRNSKCRKSETRLHGARVSFIFLNDISRHISSLGFFGSGEAGNRTE